MIFTDDDLKQLKEWIDRVPARALTMPKADLIKALLTRLEAAEKIVNYCDHVPHTIAIDLYQAWRKAAGK